MELTELKRNLFKIFGVENIESLKTAIYNCCIENDTEKFQQYMQQIAEPETDNMQKIFQYYLAERKSKKQDFTPKSLAKLIGKLCGNSETVKSTTVEMVDLRNKYTVESREQNGKFGGNAHKNRTYKKECYTLSDTVINDVLKCISERKTIGGYAKSVSIQDIQKNDYMLIPGRYIDFTYEDSPRRSYEEIVTDINHIVQQKNLCKLTINETVARNLGFDLDLYKNDCESGELQRIIQKLAGCKLLKSNYFTATKNKCEIKFENGSKNEISSVLIMIMNTWKQHIYFLNQEENRYLAELRDNLIGDLTSGKIDVNCGAKMEGESKNA